MSSSTAEHWDDVYGTRDVREASWFQPEPEVSLRLLRLATERSGAVVDVGAGASPLVDALLDEGWSDVTVLDVSAEALEVVRRRLSGRSGASYVVADLLAWEPDCRYDAWHDRAVFHFLVDAEARARYAAALRSAVRPGGAAVLGVFAPDGPERCSGLPTARWSAGGLADAFADGFVLEHAEREEHVTPGGVVQPFTWVVLRRREA